MTVQWNFDFRKNVQAQSITLPDDMCVAGCTKQKEGTAKAEADGTRRAALICRRTKAKPDRFVWNKLERHLVGHSLQANATCMELRFTKYTLPRVANWSSVHLSAL